MDIEYKPHHPKRVLQKAGEADTYKCKYVISPYNGCEYGCVYCRRYPNKATSEHSSNIIEANVNAPRMLRKELKNAEKGVVCICGYQPAEKDHRLIRNILKVLSFRNFPVHIITKSDVVLDDLELISNMAENSWCAVSFSINTIDKSIASIFEPNAPSPKKRMETLAKIAEQDVLTGLVLSPIIPYITDSNEQIEDVIRNASDMKAKYVLSYPLRLEDDCRVRFIDILKRHFPELLLRYKNLYEFGTVPDIRYKKKLKNMTNALLRKYGIADVLPTPSTKHERKQVSIEDFLAGE